MSFRDDQQIAACCIVLCRSVRLASAWTLNGPTLFALNVRDGKTGVSSGEGLLVRMAFDLWNGEGGVTFSRMIDSLDGVRMRMVAGLLAACATSSAAVDGWLAEHGDARAKC